MEVVQKRAEGEKTTPFELVGVVCRRKTLVDGLREMRKAGKEFGLRWCCSPSSMENITSCYYVAIFLREKQR